jgi:hypothetical protein
MGANATTFVPAYVSGEVLTAADLTVTNSGIPVFATTVTRDAAFGGTGEKTLAEGQFAYLEDTNTTQYYDGAAWQSVGPTFTSATVATQQLTTSTTFVDLTTAGPEVTVTTGTTAYVILTAQVFNNTVDKIAVMGFAVSGATTIAASDDQSLFIRNALSGGQEVQASAVYKVTLTAGSNTFTAKYKQFTSGGSAYFAYRGITVIAV